MSEDLELDFADITFGGESDVSFNRLNGTPSKTPEKERKEEREDEKKDDIDVNKHVLLVSTSYGGALNWNAVLRRVQEFNLLSDEQSHSFKDKQCFGFLAFTDADGLEKAAEKLKNFEVDGCRLHVERTNRVTPGRDPRTHDSDSEYKNTTLVLKNLPFQLKQDKLEEILNGLKVKPINVSYLYDGSGTFRGMAFVKYREIDHATKVFEAINNMDIAGRKLRVEYKRLMAESEPQEDDAKKVHDQLLNFKSNVTNNEMSFPCSTSFQRKQLHQIAEKLGLTHYSTGEGEQRTVIIKKKEKDKTHDKEKEKEKEKDSQTPTKDKEKDDQRKGQPIKSQQRDRRASKGEPPRQTNSPEDRTGSWDHMKSPSGRISKSFGAASPLDRSSVGSWRNNNTLSVGPATSLGTSPTYRNSALLLHRPNNAESGPVLQPSRQPKGPDGSNGFPQAYKESRKNSISALSSSPTSVK